MVGIVGCNNVKVKQDLVSSGADPRIDQAGSWSSVPAVAGPSPQPRPA
ncbi:MAG: hypothetical protein R2864_00920 [Syntrophotaleaceae bacterium]